MNRNKYTISCILCVVLFGICLARVRESEQTSSDSYQAAAVPTQAFINSINAAQHSWTAGHNFWPQSSVKNLLSVLPSKEEKLPRREVKVRTRLREHFDGRLNWKRCRGIRRVKEQGNCASAWALVATSVYSNRRCIRQTGPEVSAQYVLSCCHKCGVGCLGGYISDALNFLVDTGSPGVKCLPYEIFPCPQVLGNTSCATVRTVNPVCRGFCRKGYSVRQPYMDLRKAKGAYSLSNTSEVIMSEIVSSGPVAAVMDVYEDLFTYKSGVYSHTLGSLVGRHPVKIVGWGLHSSDKPYWLVVNTWGELWGDRGVLKVARETNGCNLENRVFAVEP